MPEDFQARSTASTASSSYGLLEAANFMPTIDQVLTVCCHAGWCLVLRAPVLGHHSCMSRFDSRGCLQVSLPDLLFRGLRWDCLLPSSRPATLCSEVRAGQDWQPVIAAGSG